MTTIVATRSKKDGEVNDSKRYWKFDLAPFDTENPQKERPITGSIYVSKEKHPDLENAEKISVSVKF